MNDNQTQSNDHQQREDDNRRSQRNNSVDESRSGRGDQRMDIPSGNDHRNENQRSRNNKIDQTTENYD